MPIQSAPDSRRSSLASPDAMEIAPGFTVEMYRTAKEAENRIAIVEAIRSRLLERYLLGLTTDQDTKSGFAMMAVACLLIETLAAFHHGMRSTYGKSRKVFTAFLRSQSGFEPFSPIADEFYSDIRCGILHQAETRGGWRILRVGDLLNREARTINANKFMKQVKAALESYCDTLLSEELTTDCWDRALTKLDAICETAVPPQRVNTTAS